MPYQNGVPHLTAPGQSKFQAALEWAAQFAKQKEDERNKRDLAAVETFKQENQNVYGDAYQQALDLFKAKPEMQRAMSRYGNAIPMTKIETPEQALKRKQAEVQSGFIDKYNDPNASVMERATGFGAATGRPATGPIIREIINEMYLGDEQRKKEALIEAGLEVNAKDKYQGEVRLQVAQMKSDIDKAMIELRRQLGNDENALRSRGLDIRQKALDQAAAQFEKRIGNTLGPMDKMILQQRMKKISFAEWEADQLERKIQMRQLTSPDGKTILPSNDPAYEAAKGTLTSMRAEIKREEDGLVDFMEALNPTAQVGPSGYQYWSGY